jgi:potassium channel LctB
VGLLTALGYSHVRHYVGGLAEWTDSGGPLESGAGESHESVMTSARARPATRESVRWIDWLADLSLTRLFGTWLGLVIGCALLYWLVDLHPGAALREGGQPVGPAPAGLLTALYFSFVTALSVGYGDVVPIGGMRVLAVGESLFALLLFGAVVSKLVSRRQEHLIGEIHLIAFEDRLGRVRTNLHLVLTELQAIGALCRHGEPDGALLARVESAGVVFVGELRTVHDLLFRPQQVPEEQTLEGLLASVASGLRQFHELLSCMPPGVAARPGLRSSTASMSRLAGEICSDCVPRQYAAALRRWMDQVQQLAATLAG